MHRSLTALSLTIAFVLWTAALSAGQKGQSGPKPNAMPASSATKAQAPKPTSAKGPAPHAQPSKAQQPKANPPKAQQPKGHVPKGSGGAHTQASSAKGASAGAGKPERTSAPTPGNSTTTTLSPVQQKLQRNTSLADKLSTRLPAGTDLMVASEGFKNLGQFVSAVNVSNNLNIRFSDVKARVVDGNMSLGQAIQDLRPGANASVEARRAEDAATLMIADTETQQKKRTPPARGKKRG